MTNLTKLSLAAACGIAAGLLNWIWMKSQTHESFNAVKVVAKIQQGDALKQEDFEQMILPIESAKSLQASLVQFDDLAVLLDRKAARNLNPGDVVFWQDMQSQKKELAISGKDEVALHISLDGLSYEPELLMVGNEVGFVVSENTSSQGPAAIPSPTHPSGSFSNIGPFRIVSVGSRLSEDTENVDERSTGQVLSVAAKVRPDGSFDESARRLLAANTPDVDGRRHVIAMVLYARETAPAVAASNQTSAP